MTRFLLQLNVPLSSNFFSFKLITRQPQITRRKKCLHTLRYKKRKNTSSFAKLFSEPARALSLESQVYTILLYLSTPKDSTLVRHCERSEAIH
jgi:hypothetical protein